MFIQSSSIFIQLFSLLLSIIFSLKISILLLSEVSDRSFETCIKEDLADSVSSFSVLWLVSF